MLALAAVQPVDHRRRRGNLQGHLDAQPLAQAGVCISDTSTEGRVYAMSIEHHVRNEVKLSNVANWRLYDIQREEERAEGPKCQPLQMDNCRNVTFANLYLYRIDMLPPFFCGVRLHACRDLCFHGLHVYSPGKTSYDKTSNMIV